LFIVGTAMAAQELHQSIGTGDMSLQLRIDGMFM